MAKGTDIQWCDDTTNPVGGCDGCELHSRKLGIRYCYAGVLTDRRKGHPGFAKDFDIPQSFPGRMAKAARCSDLTGTERTEKPWLNGQPRLIFVSDMGDALSLSITFEYLLDEVVKVASSEAGRRHVWQWLTKQPGRMAKFSAWLSERGIAWPTNLWVGTSVTATANLNRVGALLKVGDEETTRFLSVEPQFEALDLTPCVSRLDWIIQGGLSGTHAHPFDLAWARDLRDACERANVPYFLKQLGAIAITSHRQYPLRDGHGGDWNEWPLDLRVRQMPRGANGRAGTGLDDLRGDPGDTNSEPGGPTDRDASTAKSEPPGRTETRIARFAQVYNVPSSEENAPGHAIEIPAAILKVGLSMTSNALAGPESREQRLVQLFDATRPEWAKGEGTLFATDATCGAWFHSAALIGAGFRLHAEDVSEALKFLGTARAIHVSGATTLVSETGAEFVGRACKPYPKYQYISLRHDSRVLRIPRRQLVDALLDARKRLPLNRTAIRLVLDSANSTLRVELDHQRVQWQSEEIGFTSVGEPLPEFTPTMSIDSALVLVRGIKAPEVDLRVLPLAEHGGYGLRTIDEFWLTVDGKVVPAPGRPGSYKCRVTRFASTLWPEGSPRLPTR